MGGTGSCGAPDVPPGYALVPPAATEPDTLELEAVTLKFPFVCTSAEAVEPTTVWTWKLPPIETDEFARMALAGMTLSNAYSTLTTRDRAGERLSRDQPSA